MTKRNRFYKTFNESRYSQNWKITPAEAVRVDILLKMVGRNYTILDLGCYEGTIGNILKNNNNRIFGIDLSESAVVMAYKKGISCIVSDINDGISFKNESFDVIFAAEIIEHIFDLDNFMLEIKRVLKRGGSLILSTPNLASLGRRIYLSMGRNPWIDTEFEIDAAGHVRYFVKETLFHLLDKYDFELYKFCSDVVNFDNSGYRFSKKLAAIFPTLGKSLIVKAINR